MNDLAMLSPVSEDDWTPLPGFPGLEQIVLSGGLDEEKRQGQRTRLVRFPPGAKTEQVLVHDYFEEAYLVSGDLTSLDDPSIGASSPAYVYRPPGTPHGPFISKIGCVMIEMHYYR